MVDKNKKRPNFAEIWRETLVAMSLGWDLAIPIFAGVIAGYFLDRWLGTGTMFTLGLLVAGIAVGYYNVARFIRKITRKREQEETGQNDVEEGEVIS
jgi:ATP synthase protein I